MRLTNANPYSSPATHVSQSVGYETPSTRRLWIAYGIAPMVAPLMAAIALFVSGIVYQATHTQDAEVNPMALFFAPIFLFILGVPASYGMAGVIGMPTAFWLRRRGRLNGYTVFGAALVLAAMIALGLMALAVPFLLSDSGHSLGFLEWLGATSVAFLVFAPFVLLSVATFWLIGVRQRKRPVEAEPPDCGE